MVDKLLKSSSWESLESVTNDPSGENFSLALELANEFHSAFRRGSGKYILEHLVNTYLTKPIVRPNDDAFAQGIREGRADVVRQILQQIEFSKTGEK